MSTTDKDFLNGAFDRVGDLSLLSSRQLLERLVRGQMRMELKLSATSEYMTAALDSLDVQFSNLQIRIAADAAALSEAVAALAAGSTDTAALNAAADRVQATAVVMSGLAQPTAVADPDQPEVVADPVEDVPVDAPVDSTPTTDTPQQESPAV